MKKLIALLIIPVFLLSGCGTKANQIQQDKDQNFFEWFADEVLDMDDWGKKKKVKTTTPKTKSSVSKPSSSTKSKSSASKKRK